MACAATTFSIEYKCHYNGTKQKRLHWIDYFARLVPPNHSVDLKTSAVVIDIRLFGGGTEDKIGICVRRRSGVHKCVRDTVDYHSLGSHGAHYYRSNINLNTCTSPCSQVTEVSSCMPLSRCDDWD